MLELHYCLLQLLCTEESKKQTTVCGYNIHNFYGKNKGIYKEHKVKYKLFEHNNLIASLYNIHTTYMVQLLALKREFA